MKPERSPGSGSLHRLLAEQLNSLEMGNVMIVGLNPEGCVEIFNEAAERITGYKRDEILGRSWFETVVPRERYPEVWQVFHRYQSADSGEDKSFWNPVLTKEGRERYIRWQNSRAGGGDEFEGTISFGVDVTDQVLAEKSLRDSEHQYRMLIEQSCDPIYVVQAPTRLVLVNPAWERLIGYSNAEATSPEFDFLSIIAPESRAFILDRIAKRARGIPTPSMYEFRALTRDGRTLDLEASVVEIQWKGAPASQVMYRDITSHKEAERKLRLSDRIYQRVGALVVAAGPDGKITYVGPSVKEILGYEPSELMGEAWWNLTRIDPDERASARDRVAGMAKGTIPVPKAPYEQLMQHRYGSSRWILWHDTAGPDREVIGVGQDITERKNLEQQLRQAQKMEAVGRLAGGIAHDFNNLLTAINGYSELILTDLSYTDPLRREVEEIRKAGDRAANLTRQLLAFSRKQMLRPRVLDLNTVILEIEKLLRRLIREDIALETDLQPDLGRAKADPGQIEQVILNLVINARDAMPQGGKLVIRTATVKMEKAETRKRPGMRPGPYVRLTLTDTGCGMDADTLAHAFEPFFTTKDVGKGTGLGLSTAYGIIKQSGGCIYVFSEQQKGTTFEIYLPCVQDEVEPDSDPDRPATHDHGKATILVVEDEEMIRALCLRILRLRGYSVLEAPNGREALAVAERHRGAIHLLISDMVMPEMGGKELVQLLLPSRPEMKVLFLTGYADDSLAGSLLSEVNSSFLLKPFSPRALTAKVRDILLGSP